MRVLVTGANGQLGRDLVDALSGRVPVAGLAADERTGSLGTRPSCDVVATDLPDLDITDRDAVLRRFDEVCPDAVIHGAAFTAVDACESDPDLAFAVNAVGTRNVAEGARRTGAHLVYVSTDYVFDGTSPRPYLEWDTPHPASVYGRSKHAGELECSPHDSVVRISWVCGYHGTNMVKTVLRLADGPGVLRFVDDQRGSPTFTADLAGVLAEIATSRRPGRFHVTNQGVTTWFGLAREVLSAAGHDPARVEPVTTAELDPPRPAPRPANSVLDNAALRLGGRALLPPWEDGLRRLVRSLTGKAVPVDAVSPGTTQGENHG
jgi:dTDP-4-dehydrorhamnose reductase